MGALKQDPLSGFALFAHHFPNGRCKTENLWRHVQEQFDQRVAVNRLNAQTFAQWIVVLQGTINTRFQRGWVGQIRDTNGATTDLILITRPNAATGCADFCAFAGGLFTGAIKLAVERQDQRCIFRDHQGFWRNINALPGNGVDFLEQAPGVQNHPIADHRQLATAHNTRRQRMQFINRAVDHKSVARIVPPLEARDHIGTFAEPVNDLTFSFVTPLGAYNDDICHGLFLSQRKPGPS